MLLEKCICNPTAVIANAGWFVAKFYSRCTGSETTIYPAGILTDPRLKSVHSKLEPQWTILYYVCMIFRQLIGHLGLGLQLGGRSKWLGLRIKNENAWHDQVIIIIS